MELFIIYVSFLICYNLFLFLVVHFACRVRNDLPRFERIKKKKIDHSFLYQLFVQFPCQYFYDLLHSDPNEFKEKGIVIFEGVQGSGKSMSMMHYATKLKLNYPLSKCLSNTKFAFSDIDLVHWKQLTDFKNGSYGIITIIDETQNWFSSKDSKNFPPEMLSVVTQNRKNRRIILGTATSFYMLSKDIRTQCTEVRTPYTFFGCFCVVVRRAPVFNSDGDIERYKFRGIYTYVQTKELRNSYDTYSVIERLSKSGFQDREIVR
jgi:ATP-dependent Clp protease ATP-binding subunit ClpX